MVRRTKHAPDHPARLEPLRSAPFRRYLTASLVSNTGTWMQLVTIPFVVDELTHSTTWVGIAAFCTMFPMVPLALIAGTWADRHPRRTIVLAGQLLMLAPALALLTQSATGTLGAATVLLWVSIYAAGNGIVNSSNAPFIAQIVEPRGYMAALRLYLTQLYAARAVGPAIAGVVLASSGPTAAFALNALSFAPLFLVLLRMPRRVRPGGGEHGAWRLMRATVRMAGADPGIRLGLLMMIGLGFLGVSMTQLVEPFTRHVLHRTAGEYGLVVTSYGIGALVGAMLHVACGDRMAPSRLAAAGMVGASASIAAVGVGPYAVAVPALFVFGVASVIATISLLLVCQSKTEDAHRGRIVGLSNAGFNGAIPLGALLGGIVADAIGLRTVLVADAVVGVGALTLVAAVGAGLRPLDDREIARPARPTCASGT